MKLGFAPTTGVRIPVCKKEKTPVSIQVSQQTEVPTEIFYNLEAFYHALHTKEEEGRRVNISKSHALQKEISVLCDILIEYVGVEDVVLFQTL